MKLDIAFSGVVYVLGHNYVNCFASRRSCGASERALTKYRQRNG